ncbi:MAG TPA: dihydrolipoyl dehydrogenase [Stellaceae bacterium]|jgi:dihydrolipoamide dehydrogenase|nr:dihydrolipoyl dehydrogenase [Stellaceae bacterium]
MKTEVAIPDIGDFKNVPVIGIAVAPGQVVAVEDVLITLESDKATLEIPAPVAGRIVDILVKLGDRVGRGTPIVTIETASAAADTLAAPAQAAAPRSPGPAALHAPILVLGAGPGGYTAAFRAADLGQKVVLIDARDRLGGVCLNVGCIPSKALLHAAKVLDDADSFAAHGIAFAPPAIDLAKLRGWKDGIVSRLTNGLAGLARQRKVETVQGHATFTGPNAVSVRTSDGEISISFDKAIIAAGAEPVTLPFLPQGDPRIIDSTGALALDKIPERLLVLGGGIIGLEMATVYGALGARITIVELMAQLIPGLDEDLVAPLQKRLEKRHEHIWLSTKLTAVEVGRDGLTAHFAGPHGTTNAVFDQILVAVGRRPNGAKLGAAAAGIAIDGRGFIPVDGQMRTNVPHIFAIGDVVGQPMLAHKAVHQAKLAAEVASGHDKQAFDARVIPAVAYTDPEIAWAGMTENEAKAKAVRYGKGVFPWAASGRSLSLGRDEGLTKLIFDETSGRILGAGIVGPSAGELIAEVALAIEMGADATDIGLTIHAHPTLSETIGMAADAFEGTLTDLYLPKR